MPGTPSSPRATSPCATSPRRATAACTGWGPAERDYALYVRLPAPQAPLAEAEAIVCTGLKNDRTETVEDYRDLIEEGVALKLPFVCANPDLVVDVGDRAPAVRGLASRPNTSGSAARYSGPASLTRRPMRRRSRAPPSCAAPARSLPRILAIGDAVRTDLASAQGLGVDGLLIAAGIHGDTLLADGQIDVGALRALFSALDIPPAVAVMAHLRW